MMAMRCKEVQALLREAERQGFEVVKNPRSGHYKIKCNGQTVASLPGTPGGGGHVVKQIIRRETKKLIAVGYEGELRW